jgi:hypothetical protein
MIGEPHVNVAHIPPPTNHRPRERPIATFPTNPRMDAPHTHTAPLSHGADVEQTPSDRVTLVWHQRSPVHSSDTIHRAPFAPGIFTTQS